VHVRFCNVKSADGDLINLVSPYMHIDSKELTPVDTLNESRWDIQRCLDFDICPTSSFTIFGTFEVPNPLVLESVMRLSSNLNVVVGTDAEGASACDKDGLHNFRAAYRKHIEQDSDEFSLQVVEMMLVFDDFCLMYHNLCDNMCQETGIVSASTYIQNNQTQLAAMAYHGNLTVDKKKGGREDVRCVGHLGNSFPGCACIREGKGMVNTYERMPTAVHVM
jgi:hypothetical protein